jgi:hypothetical protein
MSGPWLPEGAHHDLNIEHHPSPGTGAYVPGTGHGLCFHITVSPWNAIDPMISVLKAKHAEPQIAIGGRPGYKFPVVVQFLPLEQWGKALAHPAGTPETNRVAGVQIEICATVGNAHRTSTEPGSELFDLPDVELPSDLIRAAAKAAKGTDEHRAAVLEDIHLCMHEDDGLARAYNAGVGAWTDDTYKALANLIPWIENRVDIPRHLARTFENTKRFGPDEFAAGVDGWFGHCHVPNNTHYDPTRDFKGKHLVGLVTGAPYEL